MKTLTSLAVVLSVQLCLGVCTGVVSAAPGGPDLTFGSNGLVIMQFGVTSPEYPFGRAMAIQPDGKIVVVGQALMVDPNVGDLVPVGAVVRLTADGFLDPAFGGGDGWVLTPAVAFEGGDLHEWDASAVIVQPDGTIVVAGGGDFGNVFLADGGTVLARYHPDGSLDRNFARFPLLKFDDPNVQVYPGNLSDNSQNPLRAGMVVVGGGFCAAVGGLARQPDGKLVVGGCEGGLARLNADGSPDLSFGPIGSGRSFVPGFGDGPGAFAIQTDGKIVIVGASNLGNFTVARVTTDGQRDLPFGGGDGIVFTELGLRVCDPALPPGFCEPAGGARAVMIQPDGKIVVAGTALVVASIPGRDGLALARYHPDGSLDPSFGINGTVTTDFGDWTEARAAALQADGKIVVAGMNIPSTGCERPFVARYNADGTLDDSFGVNGRTLTDFSPLAGPGCNGVATALAIQTDGKIVAAGSASAGGTLTPTTATFVAVARYLGGSASGGNTPVGAGVSVQLNAVTLTFENVTQGGETTVTTSLTGPQPPSGFQLGNPATYFDITTTAQFSGAVDICISYAGIAFGNEANLRLMHFAGGSAVDVTTSLDAAIDVICGRTTSLSPFAVVERVASVAELIVDLIEAIKGRALPPALETRLVSALQTALTFPRNIQLACRILDGFIALVESGAGRGQITAPRAAELIGQARAIKLALGC